MHPLVSEGLDLALYGMGTVFFFLTVLVLATLAMSRLVGDAPAAGIDGKLLAAISAAIHRHRKQAGRHG